jgi:hypothetical protein
MLYRKAAPNPPRLLLRIVATAGAGALLGVAACSSSSSSGSTPLLPGDAADQGDFDANQIMTGVLPENPDATLACGGGPCGIMVLPHPDGSAGSASDAGGDAPADGVDDATADADLSDGTTKDGGEAGASLHCPPICGVVVHP